MFPNKNIESEGILYIFVTKTQKMEETVELVCRWAEFKKAHPNASIEDFCRYYIIEQRESTKQESLVGGVIPDSASGLLVKLLARIARIHATYVSMVLEEEAVSRIEEVGILATLYQMGHPKKSEVIYSNLLDFSSGTDMIARLKTKGFVNESEDKEDKRSKRLSLTKEGKKVFLKVIQKIVRVANLLTYDMSEDDKKLCIQLLKHIDIKFSAVVHKHKGRKFDDVYREMTS